MNCYINSSLLHKSKLLGMKRVKNIVDDQDDKFYKLHDDVLRHIINLLPTRDALQTSVLSSRWRNLWRCISNIDLDDHFSFKSKDDMISFFESVDRLLVHHDSSDIKRFCFHCQVFFDPTCAHRWISEVIKHNVEELGIVGGYTYRLYPYRPFTLPLCLFKSESLTVFEIDSAMKSNSIILGWDDSSSVHLPSLKILKLSRVVFLNNRSTQNFFSNIPKLQQLCLYRCDWTKVEHLIIDIPTLEGIDVDIKYWYNRNCRGTVTVIAPNLTSFRCDTNFSIDFLLSNHSMSSPLNVLLLTLLVGVYRFYPLRFLESVKEATSLHMGWYYETNVWFSANKIAVEDLPLFMNLKHFEISAEDNPAFGVAGLDYILMCLYKMPNIESFTITVPRSNVQVPREFHNLGDDWYKEGGPRSCAVNQIKKFTIIMSSDSCTDFSGHPVTSYYYYATTMDLIRHFLNHSGSLETLEINWLCYSSCPERYFLRQIERHPRYKELKSFSCSAYYVPKPAASTKKTCLVDKYDFD